MGKAALLALFFLFSISFAGQAWSVNTDGAAITKPVLFANRIVVGTDRGAVYGIEAGSIKWTQVFNGSVVGDPALFGDKVVIATQDRVYALNSGGGVAWSYELRDVRGVAASDKVYVSSARGIYALDERGQLVWSYNASVPTEPSAELAGYVVFGSGRKVVALRNTGEKFWERDAGPFWNTRPLVWAGTVYAGTSEGELYAINIYTGETLWVYRTGDMVTSTPTHAGAYIVFGTANGWVYALNNGQLAWKERADSMVGGEMAVDGNIVYFSTRKSLYGVSGSDGSVLIRRQFGDWPHPPAVIGGNIVLGTQEGKVYAIDSSRACSILSPEPDSLVGDADVEISGRSYSKYGGVRTFVRVAEGAWSEAGGEEWSYTLDPSAFPFGVISVECYVSDSAGSEAAPFSGIQLVKGEAPKPVMKVRYPIQAREGEPFNITVLSLEDEPLSAVTAVMGGQAFTGDGMVTITPRGSGQQPVNVTKRGYAPAEFVVDVRPQPTLAYAFLFIFLAAAAAYAYFGYIKK
ncbi:MAG: PQQ-binding-like beta-propeller repeat protein [Candidatus Micrarchaeota archaeon]